MLERLLGLSEADESQVPPHDCDDHISYTSGPMGWGWYCALCGSFSPMDDITEG